MKIECPKCTQSLEFDKDVFGVVCECPSCNHRLLLRTYHDERDPLPERPKWWNIKTFAKDKLLSFVPSDAYGTMFLDIETSGAPDDPRSEISTICWWMSGRWGAYVCGIDPPADFLRSWKVSRKLVTFFGKRFDEPHIQRKFGIGHHRKHVDLYEVCKQKGMSGGLKSVAEQLGLQRPDDLIEADGADAVRQWDLFIRSGDSNALRNLLYYNAWDVILTYQIYRTLKERRIETSITDSMPFVPSDNSITTIRLDPKSRKADLLELWSMRKAYPLESVVGAEFCCTGDLKKASRQELHAMISVGGGIVRTNVVQTLDYLICGDTKEYGETGKLKKAKDQIAKGAHTRIITERQFWKLMRNSNKK